MQHLNHAAVLARDRFGFFLALTLAVSFSRSNAHSFFFLFYSERRKSLIHEQRKMNCPRSLSTPDQAFPLLFRTSRAPRIWPAVLGGEDSAGALDAALPDPGQLAASAAASEPGAGQLRREARRAGLPPHVREHRASSSAKLLNLAGLVRGKRLARTRDCFQKAGPGPRATCSDLDGLR